MKDNKLLYGALIVAGAFGLYLCLRSDSNKSSATEPIKEQVNGSFVDDVSVPDGTGEIKPIRNQNSGLGISIVSEPFD